MILPGNAAERIILLAEDQPDDVFLMRLALQKAELGNPLFVARDGQEAVDYLAGEGPYADRKSYPFPSLLLLDLNMPRMNGFDVLSWLHHHPQCGQLPVVVLSSSDLEADIQKATVLGADEYRVKPVGVQNLIKLLNELYECWLHGEHSLALAKSG